MRQVLFHAGLLAACVAVGNAQAADDKLISSAICQAMTPAGADHLQHNGSSLQAKDVAVTVICPIVRDNLNGRLLWVHVRHLRPDGAAGQTVSGKVYSCDSTYGGCSESPEAFSDASNSPTSVFVDTSGMPSGASQYFYYRTVLPVNWKIMSFGYRED